MDLYTQVEQLSQNVIALTDQVSRLTLLAASLLEQKKNEDQESQNLRLEVESLSNPNVPKERLDNGGWYDAKGICELFPILSYNKVKSRQWRTANHFPQNGEPFCKQMFNSSEISQWIDENMLKK